MAKNLVICCDGTSNQFSANNTNVVRLYQALVHDPERQVAYYHPGLGTMEAVGALTSWAREVTKLLGLVIGYGLEADVARAYRFILQSHQPDDRIYLFGFSRGAYTVRVVASLLRMYGLLRPENEGLVDYALRMQSALIGKKSSEAKTVFDLAEGFKDTFSGTPVTIHFVGVWDTVSSVGWFSNPLRLPFTANNPDILIGRHAVSLDERRAFFRQNLWQGDPGTRDLKQVWFPGDHCDVGGGHGETEDAAARVALRWMASEAEAAGLLVDPGKALKAFGPAPDDPAEDASTDLHESLTGLWRLAEFVPKRHYDAATGRESRQMNLFHRRTVPPGSLVHRSAFDRGGAYHARLPTDAVRLD